MFLLVCLFDFFGFCRGGGLPNEFFYKTMCLVDARIVHPLSALPVYLKYSSLTASHTKCISIVCI